MSFATPTSGLDLDDPRVWHAVEAPEHQQSNEGPLTIRRPICRNRRIRQRVCLWISLGGCTIGTVARTRVSSCFGDKGRPNPCRPAARLSEQGISKVGDHINANPNTTRSEHHHVRWELEQVMTRVRPEDLSATEIAALLAILRPAHARVVGGPASRPGLRILRSEHPAPKLA